MQFVSILIETSDLEREKFSCFICEVSQEVVNILVRHFKLLLRQGLKFFTTMNLVHAKRMIVRAFSRFVFETIIYIRTTVSTGKVKLPGYKNGLISISSNYAFILFSYLFNYTTLKQVEKLCILVTEIINTILFQIIFLLKGEITHVT